MKNRKCLQLLLLLITIFGFGNMQKSYGQAAILAIIFGDQVASEEFNLSLELGWNFSDYKDLQNTQRASALNFGIAGNIKFSETWYLSPSVFFVSKRRYRFKSYSLNTGNLNLDNEFIDKDGEANLNYIDIPIITWYQIDNLRFGLGPQVSFLTSSNLVFNGDYGDFSEDIKDQTESIDYGFLAAVSYELGKARKGRGIFIQVRYYQGFNDVYNKSLSPSDNTANYLSVHFSLPFITDELAKKNIDEQ